MVHEAIAAAEHLAAEGISVEVIDLRTVVPLDTVPILDSVHKTSRLLIAHEAVVPFGIGAEIAATVAREGFWDLDAPIERIGPLRPRPRMLPTSRRPGSRIAMTSPMPPSSRCRLGQQPNARAMTRCWISLVPSPISSTFESQ